MDELPSRHESASTAGPGSDEFQGSLVRAIYEVSPDGILVVDSDAQIVSLNRQFFEVWQIPPDRAPSGHAHALIGRPDQPVLEMAVERVKDPEAFLKRVQELYSDPSQDDHCEIALKDGRTLDRHPVPRALVEDDSVRADDVTLLTATLAYQITQTWAVNVEIFNLLDRKDSDIEYFYPSRLPGEPAGPDEGGFADVHFHPVAPLSVRAGLTARF